MDKDTQIIILEDILPIKANKIIYYADKAFTSKLMPKSHIPKIDMQALWLGVEHIQKNNMPNVEKIGNKLVDMDL
jgi:type IV secretory pathway TraG/TraD family ATPase VirD4